MKVTWEVDDGYVGGSRPQYIEECIQNNFEQLISWYITEVEE